MTNRPTMTATELREITKLIDVRRHLPEFVFAGIAARTVSALIRAARDTAVSDRFWGYAESFGVTEHEDFITGAAR